MVNPIERMTDTTDPSMFRLAGAGCRPTDPCYLLQASWAKYLPWLTLALVSIDSLSCDEVTASSGQCLPRLVIFAMPVSSHNGG